MVPTPTLDMACSASPKETVTTASHHPWKGSAAEDQSCRDASEPCQQMVTDPSWELSPVLTAGHGEEGKFLWPP